MQPYFFPYIGYFQLVNVVDKFIFYDDVNYIKKGWVNRNRILVNGEGKLFTVPVVKSSQNKLIDEIECELSEKWKNGFKKTLHHSYKKAPYYNQVLPLIEKILSNSKPDLIISNLAAKTVKIITKYLELETVFEFSSISYPETQGLEKASRLKSIVKLNHSDNYINLIGGMELYNKNDFAQNGIILNFLQSGNIIYQQFSNKFIANLSIIDVLMFNSKEEIGVLLNKFRLE